MKNKSSKLLYCFRCGYGIGTNVYKSAVIDGEYCCGDCYSDALCDEYGFGLKGKFEIKCDGHGGVILI